MVIVSFKRGVGVIVSMGHVLPDTHAGTFFNDIVPGVNLPLQLLLARPFSGRCHRKRCVGIPLRAL